MRGRMCRTCGEREFRNLLILSELLSSACTSSRTAVNFRHKLGRDQFVYGSIVSLTVEPCALLRIVAYSHCICRCIYVRILSFSGRYALAELSDNHRTHLSQGIRGPSLHHSADVCRHKTYRMAPIHKVHHLCCEPATNPAKVNLNHVKPCNSHHPC